MSKPRSKRQAALHASKVAAGQARQAVESLGAMEQDPGQRSGGPDPERLHPLEQVPARTPLHVLRDLEASSLEELRARARADEFVAEARAWGVGWGRIGAAAGINAEAARYRWGRRKG